jgi:hypothetical protein
MIKSKRHLFEGCPESPIGLVLPSDVYNARLNRHAHLSESDSLSVRSHKVAPNRYKLKESRSGIVSVELVFKGKASRAKPKLKASLEKQQQKTALELSDLFRSVLKQARPDKPQVQPGQTVLPAPQSEPEVYITPHKPEPYSPQEYTNSELVNELPINYDRTLSEEAARAGVVNTVNLPEKLLTAISKKTKRVSDDTSRFMLKNIAPAVLSYSAASKIVAVALKDGLNIEVDVDEGMNAVIKEMSRLDLAFHYLRRTSLPKSVKQQYMGKLTELLVSRSVTDLEKYDKSRALKNAASEVSSALEGIVVRSRGGGNKQQHQEPRKGGNTEGNEGLKEFLRQATTEQSPARRTSALGVRRARNEYRPLEGGI